jgi:hypothetical protein
MPLGGADAGQLLVVLCIFLHPQEMESGCAAQAGCKHWTQAILLSQLPE